MIAAIGLAATAALVARGTQPLWRFSRREAEAGWDGEGRA